MTHKKKHVNNFFGHFCNKGAERKNKDDAKQISRQQEKKIGTYYC